MRKISILKLNKISKRGHLIKELDKLFSDILFLERGPNCEIHKCICGRVGNMHLLSKQSHPKLRFEKSNIIRAGWFCSHYWSHHNPDDNRAMLVKKRIVEIYGPDWKEKLLERERYVSRMDKLYLFALKDKFTQELKQLKETNNEIIS